MIADQTVNVKDRLDEARDNRDVCIREMRRAENLREWSDAAGWRDELAAVQREIRALTDGRGY